MDFDYDVVIVGGAFSGAATALMLKRHRPNSRVLIIEKSAALDRKVGESTTEVSSCYMTRILGLANYLGHEHLIKQGLRLWFCKTPEQRFDDCVEVGPRYSSRVQTFQVDRAKLDSHLLELAANAGCDRWRPAKVAKIDLNGANGQTVNAIVDGTERSVRARWIVDATGRATMLARKLRYFGKHNASWRELYDGFVREARVTKLLRKGLLRWWKAEITNLRLMFKSTARLSAKQSPAASPVEA
jgi:flavin-dependent dehydrogenase